MTVATLTTIRLNKKVEYVVDHRSHYCGVTAYLKDGWQDAESGQHFCKGNDESELAAAVRRAQKCRCDRCEWSKQQSGTITVTQLRRSQR